jgi:glycosyltransferase involved in cell wall biosynthesis
LGKSGRRLLILSYVFAPSIGGIETVSDLLARILSQRGYEIVIVTCARAEDRSSDVAEPFRVLRNPGPLALTWEIHKADIVLQSNMALKLSWPLWILFPFKPFILVHHTPLARPEGRLAWQDRLKHWLLWRPYCLSVSRYLASTIWAESKIVPNPYASTVFKVLPEIERNFDVLFVGRLVIAKGADTLLRAFQLVLRNRPQSVLRIVGVGPEEGFLRELAASLGIDRSVLFLGSKQGHELAVLMNEHKILVIPSHSQPPEALSVVALEGIACGCVPVASRQGGLPDAVGNAGKLFEEGNSNELAEVILNLLDTPDLIAAYRSRGKEHLKQFDLDVVADAYESHFIACRK